MRRFLVLLVSLFTIFPCLLEAGAYIGRSGVGSVEGFVYNGVTLSRLMGVRVEVPYGVARYTDHLGFFKIKDLPIGVNHLVFRLPGFVPQEEVFVVYEDEKVYLTVLMWPIGYPVVEYPVIRFPYYPPPIFIYPYYYRFSRPAIDWWYLHRGLYYYYIPYWRYYRY